MSRSFALAALLALPLTVVACGATDTMDNGTDTSADELGKVRHHYEPSVGNVHFNGGCGIIMNPPQKDCSYGFVLNYTKSYADLETTVTHQTNNATHTITIKLDTWSYGTIHPMVMTRPEDLALGTLNANIGQAYTVKVVDRTDKALWTGKVTPLYHL